jgi:ABC-2 type transport system permease protein
MLHFIQFEIKNLLRTPFFGIVSILLLGFILFATYNGKKRVDNQLLAIETVKNSETEFYDKHKTLLDSIEKGLRKAPPQWFKNPENPLPIGAFRGAGSYAILTPAPLSAISTGQSDIFPTYTKVAVGNLNAGKDNDNFENPFNTAIGQFDLAFVLGFIFPLLIIAFSYNLLSAEREQGTLRLLLSIPLNINVLLFNKIVFRYLLLLSISFFWLVISFVIFGISISNSAFLSFILAVGAYSFVWFLLSFAVNLLAKSSATNAMILLGCWLFFAFIVPSTVNMLAGSWYPVPSRVEFVTAQREIDKQVEQEKEKILADFYAKNTQFKRPTSEGEKTWKDWWREGFAEDNYALQLKNNLQKQYAEKANAQRNFANGFQYFSPTILFQNTLNKIAATDTETYLNFQKETENFERKWTAYFETKFMKDEKMTVKDFESFPKFEK